MVLKLIMKICGNFLLPLFDCLILELIDSTALYTNDMIVVAPQVELEYRVTAFEIMAPDKTGCLKLSQYPIDRGQSDFFAFFEQDFIHILGAKMMLGSTVPL